MNLPMSWDEWAEHDGVALAARVSKGELTAAELAAQAAAGIARVDPALSAVVEVFEDAIADPSLDGTNLDGPFAGLPFLMKDLGPTMKGRLQEMGSAIVDIPAGQPVLTKPNLLHWHGAAPDQAALQFSVYSGTLEWKDAVTDEQYLGKK